MAMKTWDTSQPIRCLSDIEALEKVPLEQRFESWDINAFIEAGCRIDPSKTAIHEFSSADPDAYAAESTFQELHNSIRRYANLFHDLSVRKNDVVLCMLPIVD